MQDKSLDRDTVACRLAEDLVGPRAEDEELTARPSDVYLTGILWPQRTAMSGEDDDRLGTAGAALGRGERRRERCSQDRIDPEALRGRHIIQRCCVQWYPASARYLQLRHVSDRKARRRRHLGSPTAQGSKFQSSICRPALRVRLRLRNTVTGCPTSRSVSDASMPVDPFSSLSRS